VANFSPRPSDALALEIARCPIVQAVLAGDARGASCRAVVEFQKDRPVGNRWVPEPWSGHLSEAQVLFLSSNPGAGDPEDDTAPGEVVASRDDDYILHSFEDAYDDGPWPGIHDGTRLRSPDGKPGKYIRYWGWCQSIAEELFGREVRPGHDYALTEMVHCGTQHEIGVWDAAQECVPRYLERVLAASAAPVVLVVGAVARDILSSQHPGLAPGVDHLAKGDVGGRPRLIAYIPHPSAFGGKTLAARIGTGPLQTLRDALR